MLSSKNFTWSTLEKFVPVSSEVSSTKNQVKKQKEIRRGKAKSHGDKNKQKEGKLLGLFLNTLSHIDLHVPNNIFPYAFCLLLKSWKAFTVS